MFFFFWEGGGGVRCVLGSAGRPGIYFFDHHNYL